MTTATYNRYRRKGQIQHFQSLSLNHFLTLTAFDREIMDFNTNSPFLIVTCAPLDLTLGTILLATRLAALEDSHSLLCGTMSLAASITGFRRREHTSQAGQRWHEIFLPLYSPGELLIILQNHLSHHRGKTLPNSLQSELGHLFSVVPRYSHIDTMGCITANLLNILLQLSCESSRGNTVSYLSPHSQFWRTLHVYWMTNK